MCSALNQANALYEFMTQYISFSSKQAYLKYKDMDIGTNEKNQSNVFGPMYFRNNLQGYLIGFCFVELLGLFVSCNCLAESLIHPSYPHSISENDGKLEGVWSK
ncbi:unnamed protein product [Cuscuta europaea]|uniref:Uncharacterized protein n=1 Tax=Cuscuta europaea TaxID=41803 RepID=A0A9P1E6U7_CUSEU|nr:unnamed protein product [Cuscuta europaea]